MGISVAMVGTGAFAQGFIPLFKAHPLVERIALCDLDAEKLEDNKARHGIAESFPSLDEVCASDFDAAVIITQPWLHGPQAVQALRAQASTPGRRCRRDGRSTSAGRWCRRWRRPAAST